MKRMEELLTEFETVFDRTMIEDFVARGWLRPLRDEEDFVFEEIDVARVQLIYELHQDMALDTDAMDLILSLLDQLYRTRAQLSVLRDALTEQPENVRDEIRVKIESAYAKQD